MSAVTDRRTSPCVQLGPPSDECMHRIRISNNKQHYHHILAHVHYNIMEIFLNKFTCCTLIKEMRVKLYSYMSPEQNTPATRSSLQLAYPMGTPTGHSTSDDSLPVQ